MKYDTMKMTAVIIIPLLWEGLCTKCEGVAVLYVWLTKKENCNHSEGRR